MSNPIIKELWEVTNRTLPRIELKNHPWKIKFAVSPQDEDLAPAILFESRVADRNTGDSIRIGRSVMVPLYATSEEVFVRWLYEQLLWFVEHELRECFYLGHVRVYNPHTEDKDGR